MFHEHDPEAFAQWQAEQTRKPKNKRSVALLSLGGVHVPRWAILAVASAFIFIVVINNAMREKKSMVPLISSNPDAKGYGDIKADQSYSPPAFSGNFDPKVGIYIVKKFRSRSTPRLSKFVSAACVSS